MRHGTDPQTPFTRRQRRALEEAASREPERPFSRGVSLLAMASVLGIGVATSVPAMSLLTEEQVRHSSVAAQWAGATATEREIQALDEVRLDAGTPVVRESGSANSRRQIADLDSMRIADTFTNNPNGAIQWPFPVGVPISSYYGPRSAPTAGASTNHLGVDFTPGEGVPIRIIADGVVRQVVTRGDGCGVNVTVDHMIAGQLVSSKYCHMQSGSVQVSEGQPVTVGTIVGRVGNTGISTGAHLHLEIRLNGTEPTDPYAWLTANAG